MANDFGRETMADIETISVHASLHDQQVNLTMPYLLHDRDSIFARELDESIARLGIKISKSVPQSPTANAICERVIGSIRRECLDWLIPMSEAHLRIVLKSWVTHYNGGRPHMSLGPGVPDPPSKEQSNNRANSRHHLDEGIIVRAHSVLGGLHHEYSLAHRSA